MSHAATAKRCREVVALLGDYVDGRLPPAEHAALEAHLAECPPCGPLVQSYRAVRALGRDLSCHEIPADCAERLAAFLRRNVRRGA